MRGRGGAAPGGEGLCVRAVEGGTLGGLWDQRSRGTMTRVRSGLLHFLLVFSLYSALTAALTWPAALHLSDRVIGPVGDNLQNVWNVWWMKTALLERHVDPFFTPLLYHPFGTTLLFHTLSSVNTAILAMLAQVLPLLSAYNLGILVTFPIGGVGMYYLARHLVGAVVPALLGGVVFSFSAYHVAHAASHLQLSQMGWTPLFVLFLIKAFEEERGATRHALLAGFFLAVASLSCFYAMAYSFAIAAIYLVWRLATAGNRSWRGLVRRVALIGVPFAVLMGPVLVRMALYARSHRIVGGHEDWAFAADLLSFVTPGLFSSYAARTRGVWSSFTGNELETANFLGIVVPLTALAGILSRWRREYGLWLLVGGVGLTLSLGAHLHVMGRIYDGAHGPSIPLPYLLLRRLPGFSQTGMPVRFQFMTLMALSVLTAYGARTLSERWFVGRGRRVFCGALVAVACLEQLSIPFPTTAISVPDFYRQLHDGALLEVTNVITRNPSLLYQTVHGRPVVGGYVARPTVNNEDFLYDSPVVGRLFSVEAVIARFQVQSGYRGGDLEARLRRAPAVYALLMRLPEPERGEMGRRTLRKLGVGHLTLPYVSPAYFKELQRLFPSAAYDEILYRRLELTARIVDHLIRTELGCELVWETKRDDDFSLRVYRVPPPG